MATDANAPDTIVLIHGLWLTPLSWEKWIDRYKSKGYNYPPEYGPLAAVTPGTPGGILTMIAEYGKLSLKEDLGLTQLPHLPADGRRSRRCPWPRPRLQPRTLPTPVCPCPCIRSHAAPPRYALHTRVKGD